jgi:glycolate oxidase
LPIANLFHAGDGNLHPMILFDVREPGILERVMDAGREILGRCIEAGGTITGEHGVGMEKQAYMPLIFSANDLEIMARVRSAIDPTGRFNPGKVLPSSAHVPTSVGAHAQIPEGMWV